MHPISWSKRARLARKRARPARAFVAGLLVPLLLTLGTAAGMAAERQKLRYQIEVGGVQVGAIAVAAERDADSAEASIDWTMGGLLGLVESGKGSLESSSRITDGEVLPASFTGRFVKSDRDRKVSIRYGQDGSIEDLRLTKNGKKRKSEVPEDLRANTIDTLTACWRLRRWVTAGPHDEPLALQVFDGRRRYDLIARDLGAARADLDGREVAAERIELRLVPKAGFDDDRVFGRRVDPDQPWAELLVSQGPDPIPLTITGSGRLPWRIVLDRK